MKLFRKTWILLYIVTSLTATAVYCDNATTEAKLIMMMRAENAKRIAAGQKPFPGLKEFNLYLMGQAIGRAWHKKRRQQYAVIEPVPGVFIDTCEIKTWPDPGWKPAGIAIPYKDGKPENGRILWANDIEKIEKDLKTLDEKIESHVACLALMFAFLLVTNCLMVVWLFKLSEYVKSLGTKGKSATPSRPDPSWQRTPTGDYEATAPPR